MAYFLFCSLKNSNNFLAISFTIVIVVREFHSSGKGVDIPMAYIIYQESGKLANAAKLYNELRIAGKLVEAIALYREVTGDNRELRNEYGYLPPIDSCWWVFNADSVIKSYTGITSEEMATIYKNSRSERAITYAICKLAEKKQGGKWESYYEY
jgi:hypothetical protein